MKTKQKLLPFCLLAMALLAAPASWAQTLNVLHTFTGTVTPVINGTGATPQAGLILACNTFYGTTSAGRANGVGTVIANRKRPDSNISEFTGSQLL